MSSYLTRAEREIDLLEQQLDETDDPKEKEAVRLEIREIQREVIEQQRWLDEGDERGWL